MRDVFDKYFTGISHPIFFGNGLTPDQQTNLRGKPLPYIKSAIEILQRIGGKNIVEIGCMRQNMPHKLDEFNPYCCNDGHSTIHWAATGNPVWSVDISPQAVEVATNACRDYPNAKVSQGDGIAFLRDFSDTIDLLFLDAWDGDPGTPFAEKHLEAFLAAIPKMATNSIILIDDTDVWYGGKGRLVIPAAIRHGYDLALMGRCTLLTR